MPQLRGLDHSGGSIEPFFFGFSGDLSPSGRFSKFDDYPRLANFFDD